MLAVSGRLNLEGRRAERVPRDPARVARPRGRRGRSPPDASERDRRSVYVFVKRNLRYPLFALFDAPDRNETCSRRFATTTAPQALTL